MCIRDREKVECIQKFPTPKNKKQLQSFLGLRNYYRKFQKNYSEMTDKFSHQLSSKNKWTWGVEQDITLQLIKNTVYTILYITIKMCIRDRYMFRQVWRQQRDDFHGIFFGKRMSGKESGAENPRRKFSDETRISLRRGCLQSAIGQSDQNNTKSCLLYTSRCV